MIRFAKGHGTENDFIILPDEDAELSLAPDQVALLCDRRAGLGADGILRVARTGALVRAGVLAPGGGAVGADALAPGSGAVIDGVSDDDWFMDYRNADGSIAEMCGNGVRVFVHWLRREGLVDSDRFVVGTRAGAREVTVHRWDATDAVVTVNMGIPQVTGVSTCRIGNHSFAGLAVDMGNPHLACVIPGLTSAALAELPIAQQPEFDAEFFPDGVNVEVLTELTPHVGGDGEGIGVEPGVGGVDGGVVGVVHMRVHERGSGETRSCGTGTVAAVRAALADQGIADGTVVVRIPGGQVAVTIRGDESMLTGPSKIVAEGTWLG